MSTLPIFDEWMESGAVFTTSVGIAERLGRADQLGLQLNVPVGSTAPSQVAVVVYLSQDGHDFVPRKVTIGGLGVVTVVPQILATAFTMNKLNVFTWGEPWPAPPVMKYVQVQVSYTGPAMRITLYTTTRERRIRARSYDPPCDGCAEAAEHPGYMRALHALAPNELAALRGVAKSAQNPGAARRALAKMGPRIHKKFDAAVNAAVLQILAGSE